MPMERWTNKAAADYLRKTRLHRGEMGALAAARTRRIADGKSCPQNRGCGSGRERGARNVMTANRAPRVIPATRHPRQSYVADAASASDPRGSILVPGGP